jgi:uncharacterized membrane protein YagU involved in acid resistance
MHAVMTLAPGFVLQMISASCYAVITICMAVAYVASGERFRKILLWHHYLYSDEVTVLDNRLQRHGCIRCISTLTVE